MDGYEYLRDDMLSDKEANPMQATHFDKLIAEFDHAHRKELKSMYRVCMVKIWVKHEQKIMMRILSHMFTIDIVQSVLRFLGPSR
jgi:hypothetical protein